MIIAIDGPAASGKGTLGKKLAAHYGFRHLDTGLLYRAVAKALLDAEHAANDEARAIAAAKAIDPARFDEVVVSCRPWLSLRRAGGRWIPPDVDRPGGAAPQ